MSAQSRVKDLIAELENIYMLLEDGELEEAHEELICQSGTITAIAEDL